MDDHLLHLQERALLRDDVHALLRDAILHRRFQPGEKLAEDFLAKTFAISRTPIREALNRLEMEGFVEAVPRRGFVVARLSSGDLDEIYEIRLLLESRAAETAITRITPSELEALERNHAQNLDCLDAPNGASRYVELNSEFHRTIYAASGNTRMAEIIRRYMEVGSIYWGVQHMERENRLRLLGDHGRIIAILREQNRGAIGKAIRQHVLRGRDLVRRAIEEAGTAEIGLRRTSGRFAQTAAR